MTGEGPRAEVLLRARRFTVERVPVPTRAGPPVPRERVVHPGSVVLLPRLDDGRVVLVENPRFAVGATLLELPAGTLEPGEAPLECARRELLEETGYRAARVEPLLSFFPAPGFCSERMHVFLATGLEPGPPRREETELMENVELSLDEVVARIRDGRIIDGKTIAAVLYLRAFGDPATSAS
jgi:ADP-ribose pyrophosphatase